MFGTAVEHLRSAVTETLSVVRAAETEEVAREAAMDALLAMEHEATRLRAGIGALATDLEARDAHRPDAAASMADWMSARTGERRATTGSRLFLARKLRTMPVTSAALDEAEITESHATVLGRALNPRTVEAFARDEEMLVGHARTLTADQLAQVVEFWLRRHDPDGAAPPDERDRFFLSQTLDGHLKGTFDLSGQGASPSAARTARSSTPAVSSESPIGPCAGRSSPVTATPAPCRGAASPSVAATPTTSSGGSTRRDGRQPAAVHQPSRHGPGRPPSRTSWHRAAG